MSLKNNSDYNIKTQQIQFQRRIDKQPDKHQPLDADVQNFALQMLANIYDNCADILDEYNKNRGIADAGTYIEGARRVIDWATFGKIKSTTHIKNDLKNKSRELKNINVADEKTFRETFKKLSGIDYNEDNIKELMTLVYEQGVDFESEEFKTACNKAFGLKGTEKQQKYVQRSTTADGIGDIVLMLVSLGAVSKTKLMGKLTTSLFKTLEKGAGKIFSGGKVQKASKVGTSMIMGGASLAGFTLTKETLDNVTNPMRDKGKLSTWKQTGIASLESFGFGAMGGLLNETVVGPLVKYLSKPAKQAAQAVGKVLSENAEVSGKEILQASVKSQNFNLNGLFKMSPAELKSFGQVLGAHAAGFGVEVVGFAGYEAGLDAIKDICDPKTGRLPEDMTFENLTKYLGHKIGEQFSSLGTIKGISQLLMMSKGGRTAQHAMMSKMIADSEKLSDVKFKKVNDNGSESIEMTMPDGSKQHFATSEQAIQACETIMQMELIVNNLKKQESTEETIEQPEVREQTTKTETSESFETTEPVETTENSAVKESAAPIIPPRKVTIEKAIEADLREIQQIDLEAFTGRYDIYSEFETYKADLERQGVETFTMKSDDGSIIGYYQLEPVKNGELYIYSLGVKKELRHTKTGYKALKQMQTQITNLAQEQNIDKVSLDVDSSKPELVKLYKKFGFEVVREDARSEAGQQFTDYRMEANVKKVLGVIEQPTPAPKLTYEDIAEKVEKYAETHSSWRRNELITLAKRSPELMNKLLDAKNISDAQNRFDYSDIEKFFKNVEEPSSILNELLNETDTYDNHPYFRFNIDDIIAINNLAVKYPKFIERIFFAQNTTGNRRFNQHDIKHLAKIAQEVESSSENLQVFEELFNFKTTNYEKKTDYRFDGRSIAELFPYMKNPSENFKKLFYAKDTILDTNGNIVEDKGYRFNYSCSILKILPLMERYPEVSDKILNAREPKSYNDSSQMKLRVSNTNIEKLILCAKNNPLLFNRIFNETDNNSNTRPYVSDYSIEDLIKAAKESPDLFDLLFNAKKGTIQAHAVSSFHICEIIDFAKKHPEIFNMVLINPDGTFNPRFCEYELKDVLNLALEHPAEFEFYSKFKKFDGNDYRFSHYEIKKIIELSQTESKELITRLLNEKTYDDYFKKEKFYLESHNLEAVLAVAKAQPELFEKMLSSMILDSQGNRKHRVDAIEMDTLLNFHNSSPEFFDKLWNMTYTNENGIEVHRFSGSDIYSFQSLKNRNSELFDKFAFALDTNMKFRFSSSEIKLLLDNTNTTSEFFEKLLNQKIEIDGKESYRFNAGDIHKLQNCSTESQELFDILSNCKTKSTGNNYTERTAFSSDDIVKLFKIKKENPEIFDKLVNSTVLLKNYPQVDWDFSVRNLELIISEAKNSPQFLDNFIARKLEFETLNIQNIIEITKLSAEKRSILKTYLEYFNKNINLLKHADENLTLNQLNNMIVSYRQGMFNILELAGDQSLRHTVGLKYKGLKSLLDNASSLSLLEAHAPAATAELKNHLGQLPHPEQRLEKLSVIASLVGKIDYSVMPNIIEKIKSPEMTTAQQELADRIFSDRNESYSTQVENFIREFNVPESKQELIRRFLLQQNLQEKYITPPPIERQLEIIDKKINGILVNDQIPQNKKQAYLEVLNRQKQELLSNPEKYTRRRLNENVMKALSAQVEAHINLPNYNYEFTKALNREVYKLYDIQDYECLLNSGLEFDTTYFSKLFDGSSNSKFKTQFTKFLELIKSNPNRSLTEIYNLIPENNQTRRLFEENGLDYERWIHFDENSRLPFTLKIDVESSVKASRNNLRAEMSSEVAQKLDQQEVAKIIKILDDMELDSASQNKLPKIIKAIENHIQSNDYWKQQNADIKEFLDHIKIHKKNIHDLESLKDTNEELYVRLWDNDDIGRNVFFGNHVGCCTSVGHCNSFANIQHLMNSYVNGIEIVDRSGISMGNSMCYFAKVDGELTFIIDSFEANGKLGAAPEVTDAIINYAKQVCREMGRPDANVMFGPNYNKISKNRLLETPNHTVEVIGRAPENTYIDAVGGHNSVNAPVKNREMLEIVTKNNI